MHLLAHRGFWRDPAEKNTMQAFDRAFAAGYGVETDVRDFAGELVISHDPPLTVGLTFSEVLERYASQGGPGWIAINVKADGLASAVAEVVQKAGVLDRCFVFDMSVPDMLAYTRTDLTVFTRRSEFETHPPMLDTVAGVWADAFSPPDPDIGEVAADLRAGRKVAIVSPELHRRPHEAYWAHLRDHLRGAALPLENLMLCTDFPAAAEAYFNG